MRADIILIEGGTGYVEGKVVTWKWKDGYLRVYVEDTLRFEAPREKVLGVALVKVP